jgi:predicted tellurium resistance membrane protein TerC
MLDLLTDYQVWASLLTLTALEIVLGIDNLIFLSIVSGRLPRQQQPAARRIGLALALLGRVGLLFSLTWLIGLTAPIVTLAGFDLSWRDVVLLGGGAFLIVKGTMETHHMLEGHEEEHASARRRSSRPLCRLRFSILFLPSTRSSPRSAWRSTCRL